MSSCMIVDFPEPDGPTRAIVSPGLDVQREITDGIIIIIFIAVAGLVEQVMAFDFIDVGFADILFNIRAFEHFADRFDRFQTLGNPRQHSHQPNYRTGDGVEIRGQQYDIADTDIDDLFYDSDTPPHTA